MTDLAPLFPLLFAALLGTAIASLALLRGWRGWLELKRLELGGRTGEPQLSEKAVELRRLKDRIRRLEAIAEGSAC